MENPQGAVQGNSQNIPAANTPRTRSTFPLKYHLFDTHRFGEYHPHYVEEGVKEDILPIRSSHNVMSFTLKSPLMQDITMVKDYFSVPMEAILPLNWEKFFDNPVRGDDVNSNVGPTLENFWNKVGAMFDSLLSAYVAILNNQNSTNEQVLTATLRLLVLGEYFYSDGSLMTSLGCHGSNYINVTMGDPDHRFTWDHFFDTMIDELIKFIGSDWITVNVDNVVYKVAAEYDPGQRRTDFIDFRHFLSLIRDTPTFYFSSIPSGDLRSAVKSVYSQFGLAPVKANVPFNTSRLWAYQLVCAHYYSNDHIDFIYSAELYRQLVGNYIRVLSGAGFGNLSKFTRNGIEYQYDYLCARFVDLFISNITNAATNTLTATNVATVNAALGYFSALFAYRRSLRYQDYFTGSRAQPLAVGSTGVTVSGNTVDVVDITRNIQRQRFLNAVNRVRHNFEGYLQGIFGGDVPAPDYHNPFFLASTSDTIYGQETENTGTDQFSRAISITTNLRSNGSRYMLEIHCDRPCVILGLTHYDLPRVYGKSMEREFLHVDRFDMFNPFMQYIGDQPIYIQELGIAPSGIQPLAMANFSYTLRHMEYKQRYNQAAGGFVYNLPGFVFIASDERGTQSTINPDWIRSVPSEFDRFYVSLNGWSNSSYFHFIVDNFNDCSGSRPMAYAPSIL